MVNRASSGFDQLDQIIEGGFPDGAIIFYFGPPGSGKTISSLRFLQSGINQNEKGLLISTKHTYPEMEAFANQLSLDFKQIQCIDCVNWKLKRFDKSQPNFSKYEVQNLADLNTILATTIQVCKDEPAIKRIVFDSPSSMLIYSVPATEQVFRFLELLIAFVKQSNRILVFTLEQGVHSAQIEKTFEYLADGLIQFSIQDDNSRTLEPKFLVLTKCNSQSIPIKLW